MVLQFDVDIAAGSGRSINASFALPDGSENTDAGLPGVLVIHEIFGLTDDIRRIAARFAEAGYAALAPDLFGSGFRPACVARVFKALRNREGQAFDDLDVARSWLAARSEVDGERLAAAGFCMGGGFALMYGVKGPIRATADFYGDVPKDPSELAGVCPVVGGFGERDRLFASHGRRLDAVLDDLGVDHDVVIYPGVGHSFMNQHPDGMLKKVTAVGPMHVGYDDEAAEDSWRRMLSLFGRVLATDGDG